jgi:hypothetical protein
LLAPKIRPVYLDSIESEDRILGGFLAMNLYHGAAGSNWLHFFLFPGGKI